MEDTEKLNLVVGIIQMHHDTYLTHLEFALNAAKKTNVPEPNIKLIENAITYAKWSFDELELAIQGGERKDRSVVIHHSEGEAEHWNAERDERLKAGHSIKD